MLDFIDEFRFTLIFFGSLIVGMVLFFIVAVHFDNKEIAKLQEYCKENPLTTYIGCTELKIYGHPLNHNSSQLVPLIIPQIGR